jgi:hypothetical protein
MDIALVLAAVLVPLLLNARATQLIVQDVLCDRQQKLAQLLLVWLVPIIGGAIVLAVHRRAEPASRQYREAADAGDDFGYSGRMHRSIKEVLDGDD